MTNEELVAIIKNGNTKAIPQLWEQVEKLLYLLCNNLYIRYNEPLSRAGVQIDDLTQESYFAFLDAIQSYDGSKGYKFTTYLNYPLLNRIRSLVGGKSQTALNTADSLERPLEDNLILADIVADSNNSFLPVEERLYWDQVRKDLEQGISALDGIQQDVIRGKYYNGMSTKDLSQQLDRTYEYMRGVEHSAFRRLRRDRNIKQYRDDIISTHAYHSSFSLWKNTRTSSTERAVLMLSKFDRLI